MQIRHTLTVLAALALLAPGLPAIAASDPYQATITKVVRQVDWERYRTTVWQKASIGSLLLVGDTLRTGADANAELEYGDGSLTRVGSLSSLTLTGDGRREIHLDAGRVWLHVTKHSVGMKVITPGAVAAITGTELMVDFNPATRLTQVTVFEGSVNVTSDVGNLVRVLGGTSTLVPFQAPAAAPAPIQPQQFQERARIFKPLALPSTGEQPSSQTPTQPGATTPPKQSSDSGKSTNAGATDKGQQTSSSGNAQTGTKSADGSANKSNDTSKSTASTDKSQTDANKGGDKSAQPDDQQAVTPDTQQAPATTETPTQPQATDAPPTDTKAAGTPAHQDEVKPDLQGQTDTLMDPRVLSGSPTTGEVKVIVK